jgi:hypothetical protein
MPALHVGIGRREVRCVHAGVDKPVVAVLERRDIDREDVIDMVREPDILDFDPSVAHNLNKDETISPVCGTH